MTRAERITLDGVAKAAMERTRSRLNIAIIGFGVVFAVLFGRLVEVTMLREGPGPKTARVESDASYYRAASRRPERRNSCDRFASGVALCGRARRLGSGRGCAVARGRAAGCRRGGADETARDTARVRLDKAQRAAAPEGSGAPTRHPGTALPQRAAPRLSERTYGGARDGLRERRQSRACRRRARRRGLDPRTAQSRRGRRTLARPSRSARAAGRTRRRCARFKAHSASGNVLDVNNGEVLALASLPDFDPNEPGEAAKAALLFRE